MNRTEPRSLLALSLSPSLITADRHCGRKDYLVMPPRRHFFFLEQVEGL